MTPDEHTRAHAPKIDGYRCLEPNEIELINRIKAHGNATRALIDELDDMITQWVIALEEVEPGGEPPIDDEWLSAARLTLATGQMQLVRAVARPTDF